MSKEFMKKFYVARVEFPNTFEFTCEAENAVEAYRAYLTYKFINAKGLIKYFNDAVFVKDAKTSEVKRFIGSIDFTVNVTELR